MSARTDSEPERRQGLDLLAQLGETYLCIGAVQAGFELGVFEALAAGARTPAELARRLGVDARGLAILTDCLCAMDLLGRDGERLQLSAAGAAYLAPGSPAYIADSLRRITLSASAIGMLAQAVRTGRPLASTQGEPDADLLWAQDIAPSRLDWPRQAAAAERRWGPVTPGLPRGARVLDIGCGSAVKVLWLLTRDPDASIVAVDSRAEVLDVAAGVAEAMGVRNRVELRLGDLLALSQADAVYDVVHSAAVLYFYGADEIARVLTWVARALRPGGVFVSDHLVADDERSRDLPALVRALQLFLFHQRSHVPARREFVAALQRAGFQRIDTVDGELIAAYA